MSPGSLPQPRFSVVVASGGAVVGPIEYALREARDLHAERGDPVTIDLCVLTSGGSIDAGTRRRIQQTVSPFEAGGGLQSSIEPLGRPGTTAAARTDALLDHLGDRALSRLVIAGDTDLSVARLRERFGVTTVELAPTTTPDERRRLLHPGGRRRLGAIFGLTYLFYLAIGGFAGGADLVTGAISAAVVALALSHVALREEPTLGRTGWRLVRMVAVLPVLLWEIAKANVVIAAIILRPSLPIEPSMQVIDTDTSDGLERMVLANSITLTPGTLTIDVRDRAFTVHSLTARARRDLQRGRLQSLVGWVFHGSARPVPRDGEGGDGT